MFDLHKDSDFKAISFNHWEPGIISAAPHNPYYIKFKDVQTGEMVDYYDMEERERRKIERRFDEIRGEALTML